MNIEKIPASKAAYDDWMQSYRVREFYYDPANQRVVDATAKIIENWLPKHLQPLVKCRLSNPQSSRTPDLSFGRQIILQSQTALILGKLPHGFGQHTQ